jgi:hypothetical protein
MPTAAKLEKMGKPSSKMIKMRADALQPHPMAQRELVPSRLKKLIANLDLDAIGVLHAVEYPIKGKTAIWIVDGQHRWRALMEHGMGEWQVEVKIHADVKDDARASAIFLKLNDRSPVRPYDKWLNRLNAKEDEAIAINDIVLKHKMRISASSGAGCLMGISSIERTYHFDAGNALDKTLGIVAEAWGLRSFEAKIVEGIGLICARYNGVLDTSALSKKLSKYPGSATGLVGDARGLMEYRKVSLSRCIAERVIETYNSGRREGRLDTL